MGSRKAPKLDPSYEDNPVSFAQSCVKEDVPKVVIDESEYKTLTWMLIRIKTVKFARDEMHATVRWPLAEKIMEKRISIIDQLNDIVKNYEAVLGAYNQFIKDYASIACIKSPYTYAAYQTWITANNGVELEFDPAIYHYTGFQIFKSNTSAAASDRIPDSRV